MDYGSLCWRPNQTQFFIPVLARGLSDGTEKPELRIFSSRCILVTIPSLLFIAIPLGQRGTWGDIELLLLFGAKPRNLLCQRHSLTVNSINNWAPATEWLQARKRATSRGNSDFRKAKPWKVTYSESNFLMTTQDLKITTLKIYILVPKITWDEMWSVNHSRCVNRRMFPH